MSNDNVMLENWKMEDFKSKNLFVPAYQREYCWEDKQLYCLIDDLRENGNDEYRLGTLIFHHRKVDKDDNIYDIVDGQQRLLTLYLMQKYSKEEEKICIKDFKSRSNEEKNHLENAKYIIDKEKDVCELIEKISFSVLIIEDSTNSSDLDIAFTFFSNTNSRGVPLTDYDLLKSHHLRYIDEETQQEYLVKKLNDLSLIKTDDGKKVINCFMDVYLYRLRQWSMYSDINEDEKYYIKNEYSASKSIEKFPMYGEQLNFNESIQGGNYYFVYVNHFYNFYINFVKEKAINNLKVIDGESHWRFREIIEAFCFCYYLKFGNINLNEVTLCIAIYISYCRFCYETIRKNRIYNYAKESKIALIINRAISPTFVIAELLDLIRKNIDYNIFNNGKNIQYRYKNILKELFNNTKIESFSELETIIKKIGEEANNG